VPLVLLCTARPELYEQHPRWAAGLRNATTISAASGDEIARRVLLARGRMFAVRRDEIPGGGPAAAILRHPV
jgi:hypothetical protein